MYVAYIGKLFLRMLKALILPLIIPSLIAAIGQLDMNLSGKVGGRAVGYYMSTTVLAVILGIILVSAIHPGVAGQAEGDITKVGESRNVTAVDTLLDLARNLFPPNLIQVTTSFSRFSKSVSLFSPSFQSRLPFNNIELY